MTVYQIVGTWVQIAGVLVALFGLGSTYRRYATRGTLKRVAKDLGRRIAQTINPKWRRGPRLRVSGAGAWGTEVDDRSYELPHDTDQALQMLASYIQQDRAMLLIAKSESGHALRELDGMDARQRHIVEAGVRDFALGGIAITAFGLIVTAIGIFLTLF
ncbi:hypothetical protein [Leifsonia shinshuensis]|uniref:hypothetical protein n=1 Tax=Leifsonia shinshuensis TaxID=150026 RepID=UPI00285748C3|nr:hypothetical protein [Leifsonia shinshuensis]MDR6970849.1 hypothetical protein [Leifsonia shinshuensis]